MLFVVCISLPAQELITYKVPKELLYRAHNDDFTVNVRTEDGSWKDLYEYAVRVDLDNVQKASMVSFDFSGKVEVRVRKNNGTVNSVRIRPYSLGIRPRVQGNIISFTLDKPTKLSLEVDGDKTHNLHIFANEIIKDAPSPSDPSVIYFGAGLHRFDTLPGKAFKVPSDKTIFIDGGAVLTGKLLVDSVTNVKIIGHGIIYEPERGIEVTFSDHVTIDGPIFINPTHYTVFGGQSSNLHIRNIKSFSCKGWSDGIDLMSCNNVEIDGVFMRNSDDCIAIYGHRWDYYGSSRNISISNSTLWADIAHATNIGLHGDADRGGDTIEYVTFRNIDILEHDEDDRNYQGCLSISASDNNLVRNITYENIRIDDIQEGMLFNFRVFYNEKYCKAPGRGISDIHLIDVSYNGTTAHPSVFSGYNIERKVSGLTIENMRVNNKRIKSLESSELNVGEFVEKVSFLK